MRKTFIISAFPACGKTCAVKYLSERGVDVLDSDSSKFSWITDENGNKVRNPRFIGSDDLYMVTKCDIYYYI